MSSETAITIPLVDVAWQHAQVRDEIDRGIDALLTDVTCDGVHFCKELERQFEQHFGPGIHAVSVQSGTAGQFLSEKALGIGPGDEVITVANSDMATTSAISHVGARFVLVDIDPRTHNIDPAKIEAAITPATRAILAVHMYGLPAEMDAITEIARRHNLFVIEDATLALGAQIDGAQIDGRKAGTFGDIAFFSFAPRKVLGGTGNGGMIITRDPQFAHRASLYKGYGLDPARGERPIAQRQLDGGLENLVEGHNLKMDGIQALVVSAKFKRADEWAQLRQAAADHYASIFKSIPGVEPPQVPSNMRHAWRNYVITLPEGTRDAVRAHLRSQGIAASTLYTPPVHLQPVYRHLGLGPGSFPGTESVATRLLCLPIYPGLEPSQIEAVGAAIAEALESVKV